MAETRSIGFGDEDGADDDDSDDKIEDGENPVGSDDGPPESDVRGATPATTTMTTTKIATTHTTTTTILSQTTTISPGGGGDTSPARSDGGDAPSPMKMNPSFLKRSVTAKPGVRSAAKAREGPPSAYEVKRCARAVSSNEGPMLCDAQRVIPNDEF